MDSQTGIFTSAPAQPNETAMWIALFLIVVPGALQIPVVTALLSRFTGGGGTATVSSPSPPAEPGSAPPSPSSSVP
jgi:hypothetical protein